MIHTNRISVLKSELQKTKQSLGEWIDEALRLEGELEDTEKQLTAARNELAEMRELIKGLDGYAALESGRLRRKE